MNNIVNRPFPLMKVGFAGYSSFLDGLIALEDVSRGPIPADAGLYTCENTYVLKPEAVNFRGAFDISPVWGTDSTEGIRLRLWSSAYELNARYEVNGIILDLIWSWMDSEPRELCFLKAKLNTDNINYAAPTYALGIIERARMLWPKELFNTSRWKSASR